MSIDINMKQVLKFNRSSMAKTHYNKSDLEQIALAISKSQYNILPVGSAGLAHALGNVWLPEEKREPVNKQFPILPKLILSGSKTTITATQINKLSLFKLVDRAYETDNFKLSMDTRNYICSGK